jgi:glutaredoxin
VKEFLSRASVPFTTYNVDEDAGAYDALIARGFRTVPITIAGECVVRGFDAAALEAIAAEWRSSGGSRG